VPFVSTLIVTGRAVVFLGGMAEETHSGDSVAISHSRLCNEAIGPEVRGRAGDGAMDRRVGAERIENEFRDVLRPLILQRKEFHPLVPSPPSLGVGLLCDLVAVDVVLHQ
jgi:hypothetical protein